MRWWSIRCWLFCILLVPGTNTEHSPVDDESAMAGGCSIAGFFVRDKISDIFLLHSVGAFVTPHSFQTAMSSFFP